MSHNLNLLSLGRKDCVTSPTVLGVNTHIVNLVIKEITIRSWFDLFYFPLIEYGDKFGEDIS